MMHAMNQFNPLAAELFLLPFTLHGVNFLQTFTWQILFQCLLFDMDFFVGNHVFHVET